MAKQDRGMTRDEVFASEDALIDFQFAVMDALSARGITQADFAEMLGVSRSRISQMLSPEANPTIKLIGRALHALGLKTEYKSEILDCDTLHIDGGDDLVWHEDLALGVENKPIADEWRDHLWSASQLRPGYGNWRQELRSGANSNNCETLEAA